MKTLYTSARVAAGALLLVALTLPAFAQSRHRVVKRSPADAATLSGIVIDAATRAPLTEAIVKVSSRAATTASDGRFSFTELEASSYEVTVTRWGYLPSSRIVALNAGANTLEVALQPAALVNVKAKNGTTYPLDFDSTEFGYVVAFVGWRSAPELHLCLADGTEATVKTSEMKTATFPGTRTENTSCCSLAPGIVARITRADSTVADGTIRESCSGSEMMVRGRNRSTGKFEAIKLSEVETISF